MLSLVALFACNQPTEIKGRVVDIWNNPVEGATVVGAGERPLTDQHGVYTLGQLAPGTYEMKAGKDGFVQDAASLELKEGDKVAPTFHLYPKPEADGFYAVTVGDYRKIDAATVQTVGHAADAIYGIAPPSERVFVEGSELEVVYRINLSMPQIKSLGLKLRKLKFLEATEMTTVAGGTKTEVPVNLFVADGEAPIEIEPLASKNFYLLKSTAKLEPGVYAFESQDLLAPANAEQWNRIPPTIRTVYPFTVK